MNTISRETLEAMTILGAMCGETPLSLARELAQGAGVAEQPQVAVADVLSFLDFDPETP